MALRVCVYTLKLLPVTPLNAQRAFHIWSIPLSFDIKACLSGAAAQKKERTQNRLAGLPTVWWRSPFANIYAVPLQPKPKQSALCLYASMEYVCVCRCVCIYLGAVMWREQVWNPPPPPPTPIWWDESSLEKLSIPLGSTSMFTHINPGLAPQPPEKKQGEKFALRKVNCD